MSRALMARAAQALTASGWLGPLLVLNGHAKSYYSVEFLAAGVSSGLFARMGTGWRSAGELLDILGAEPSEADGLSAWLDLGVVLGLVQRRDDRYRLRRQARVAAKPANDPVGAYYVELSQLHHKLISTTPELLKQGRRLRLDEADPALIARTSRLSTPYLDALLEEVVPRERPVRLVEVGCGSGAHIATAARLNPRLTALGLELQEEAAAQARANIATWGLTDRVTIGVGDIRHRTGAGDADLVTLHQNIYYFPVGERTDLFRLLRTFLSPEGTLLVTSMCRHNSHVNAALDLWGAMTDGADRLPVPAEVAAQLSAAGFRDVTVHRVVPGGMFCGFTARA